LTTSEQVLLVGNPFLRMSAAVPALWLAGEREEKSSSHQTSSVIISD
jgi:hypothetical protein